MENVWDEIEKTRLKLLRDRKLTQKAKLLTTFCLLMQHYLIFQPIRILYGFPDRLFWFFTIYFAIFHHGSQYLTSYLLPSSIVIALWPHQNFGSYFLVFRKCGLPQIAYIVINFNAKINEVKNKIPNIINLATTTALITVENKVPNASNLVKKTNYKTKISEIENKVTTDHDHYKYIATQESNSFTSANIAARLV